MTKDLNILQYIMQLLYSVCILVAILEMLAIIMMYNDGAVKLVR